MKNRNSFPSVTLPGLHRKAFSGAGRRACYAVLFLFLVFMSACATIPKGTVDAEMGDFDLLPEGGLMYLWADIHETRPLLESISFDGLDLKKAGSILDRSNTAAAVFSGAESGERFFVDLRGKYPTFQAGFSMTFSKDWKKNKSQTGNSYWYSDSYGVGVALDSQQALVSGSDPFLRLPSARDLHAVLVPEGFMEFRTGAVLSGWIPDPQDTVNKFLTALGVPIQLPAEDFFFNVFKGKDDEGNEEWELVFRIRTESANQARGLVTIFSLARAFIVNFSGSGAAEKKELTDFLPVLFYNQPQRDEEILTLRSAIFSAGDLALLFNAISLYSN